MSDGYIQSKQRELNEELKRVEEKTKILLQEMDTVDKKIVKYDAVLSILKKQEKFQEQLKEDILKENKSTIKAYIPEMQSNLNKTLIKTVGRKFINFEEKAVNLTRASKNYAEKVKMLEKEHNEYVVLFTVLVGKLVDKNILDKGELKRLVCQALNLDKKAMREIRKKHDRQKLRKQLMK